MVAGALGRIGGLDRWRTLTQHLRLPAHAAPAPSGPLFFAPARFKFPICLSPGDCASSLAICHVREADLHRRRGAWRRRPKETLGGRSAIRPMHAVASCVILLDGVQPRRIGCGAALRHVHLRGWARMRQRKAKSELAPRTARPCATCFYDLFVVKVGKQNVFA
eukprot:scaffold13210_cov109-Isochrysis_galbana.AAC.1